LSKRFLRIETGTGAKDEALILDFQACSFLFIGGAQSSYQEQI
jgi:hypothetical protein